jgi:Tol biopolymer transport system component
MSSTSLSGATLARYKVGSLLGSGGMGEVYEAVDAELGRTVALKVLPESVVGDADRLSRFVQEARTASALNHPHLLSIYEIGQGSIAASSRPVHFIAMEIVRGETLRAFLARERDVKRSLDYLTQVADALAAAHAAGIVHRDLKPDNVMIATAGYAKVLDFGLAKLRDAPALLAEAAGAPTVTGTSPGLVMGTVGYMSPEQAQGRPADHRSDIFSFGCVLYEAITGDRAFRGTSSVDTLHQILHADPPPIASRVPSLPADLQRVVRKCLAKDPDERYQSMREIAIDLRDVRRQLDSGAVPSVPPAIPAGRSRGVALAAIGGIALVVAAALFYLTQARKATDRPADAIKIDRITTTGLVIDAIQSADGKYLAYVESDAGMQGLYLRQLLGTRPIELVARARVGYWGIAFSKDGESIFYGNKSDKEPLGALYQIPVLGGSPRVILRGLDSAVTFSPDGKRLAYLRVDPGQGGASSLVVAGADGSDVRALVTKRPPEFVAPSFFVAPSWSPDGKRISAFVRRGDTRNAYLATFDAATGSEQAFDTHYVDGTFTCWLPDGTGILYTAVAPGEYTTGNGGQIFLQPYPSGEPKRVTRDLLDYRNVSIAADGRSFVTVGFDAEARVSVIPYAGGEERRIGPERYDGTRGLAWLPDGSGIVYTHFANGASAIWIANADGSNPREIVGGGTFASPAVSPDGRTLAYVGLRGEQAGVWRSGIDGSSPALLTTAGASYLIFAPDGRSLYFTASTDGDPATYRLPIEGGTPQRLGALLSRAGVSPDGSMLAGLYRRDERSPQELAVISAETSQLIRSFGTATFASGGGRVEWDHRGDAVLYTTNERMNIWRQPMAGGPPQKVTNFSDRVVVRFALSPDGKSLAMSRGVTQRDAFVVSNFR